MNRIPVIGWCLSFIGNVSLAVPFWICWTVCGIGAKYADFLPTHFQSVPFWDCVGIFMSMAILKTTFVPTIANVSNTSQSDCKPKKDDNGPTVRVRS